MQSHEIAELVATLRRDGIAAPGWRMAEPVLAGIRAHIAAAPVYAGHVWAQSDRVPRRLDEPLEVACSTMETVLTAPGFLELADVFTPLAQDYLGEPALLYSVNAFWTAPGAAPPKYDIQDWHRDFDDRKFLALFIYGSDVLDAADGVHTYALRSHTGGEGDGETALGHKPPGSFGIAEVAGRAGTMFFADTSGMHHGTKPTRGRRLILWARWGVSDPPLSYRYDRTAPIDRAKVPYPYADHLRLLMR